MPTPFSKPCQHAGCHNYALSGQRFCKEHLNDRWQKRKGSTERGYNYRWQQFRDSFLKAHPLCEECKRNGKVTPATDVDHIVPHKGNKNIFWDENNLQALCHACHARKTVNEDGGFGNAITPRGSSKK